MEVNFIEPLCYYYTMSKLYHRHKCLAAVCPIKQVYMRGDRQVRRKFCFIVYKHDLGADKIFALVSNITSIG